ncbi:MAG: hypothetical protein GC157_07235 [Frankiales bacterium]|nr:hypothetical protein [Frankiales bacterium]
MTAPALHPAAEQVYRLLPDYIRAADPDTDWTLRRFVGAAAVGLEQVNEFLTLVDPDTSVTGTCELVNAAAIPSAWLAWLGWLVGVDTSLIPAADVRDAVQNAATTQRRGSTGAIRDVVQRTLTGSKSCRVYSNLSGTDPYLITVITQTAQTPDPVAALAAAWTEKPAGVDLELQTVAGSIYSEIASAFTDYSDLAGAFATYQDLTDYIAP